MIKKNREFVALHPLVSFSDNHTFNNVYIIAKAINLHLFYGLSRIILQNVANELYGLPSLLPQDANLWLWTDWKHKHLVNTIFILVPGEVFTYQVIFSSMGITSQMSLQLKILIKHLLMLTSDHGISDHNTFIVTCEEFDLGLLYCYLMVIVFYLTLVHWGIYYQSKYGCPYHLQMPLV